MKKVNKDILVWWGAWTTLIVLLTVPYWFNDSDSYLIWGNNLSYLFISLSGVMKAVMDTLQFHFESSVFFKQQGRAPNKIKRWNYFFDPKISWVNKYKNENPTNGRKKFLAIPIPVLFTDGWHLFQSFQITFTCLALAYTGCHPEISHGILIDFVAYSFLYRAFFFLFYKYFLIKK